MNAREQRALEAVRAGAVKHAHPFTWAVEVEFLDVKQATLQRLAKRGVIRVIASSPEYWRPVVLSKKVGFLPCARDGSPKGQATEGGLIACDDSPSGAQPTPTNTREGGEG